MRIKTAFTLIELLVVIAIIAVLMGILMPALTAAREQGKRAVCLSHLKQLTLGWVMYAGDNDGRIPGGDVSYNFTESWWVTWPKDKAGNYINDLTKITPEQWYDAIKAGQLYPYCDNVKLYRCSNAPAIYKLSYSMVDSMNAYSGWTDYSHYNRLRITNINNIKRPSERLVLLDESPPSRGTWGIKYATEAWYDAPPKLHSKGTTFSFADGHSEFWKWRDKRTLETTWSDHDVPQPGNVDLHRVQKGVWGKLGYTPGVQP